MELNFIGIDEKLEYAIKELEYITKIENSKSWTEVYIKKTTDEFSVQKINGKYYINFFKLPQFFRALTYINQNRKKETFHINQKPNFEDLFAMFDNSRNAVMTVKTVQKMIRYMALMGFNTLMLYTEDLLPVDDYKYFGYMRGRFTKDELKEIISYAEIFGVEIMPCIQTLAHLYNALRWNSFSEITDCKDILLAGEEKTYEFLESLLKSIREIFKCKRINIGMDEAHSLGEGKFKDKFGKKQQSEIFLMHLEKINHLLKKYDFEPYMWSDMFFRTAFSEYYISEDKVLPQNIIDMVPENINLIYWDYYHYKIEDYSQMIDKHFKLSDKISFAGTAYKWSGFAPIQNWSFSTSRPALLSCIDKKIKTVIMTTWGDNGAEASHFCTLITMQLYAEACYCSDLSEEHLSKRFYYTTGCNFKDFQNLDMPNYLTETKGRIDTLNPNKYLVYNDILLGLFDKNVTPVLHAEEYKNQSKYFARIKKNNGEFEYLFDLMQRLCDYLSVKCEIGLKLKKAYDEKDLEELKRLAQKELYIIDKKFKKFYDSFYYQWNNENKIFGFEIHDIRLGGVSQRLKTAKKRIMQYVEGKLNSLPELCEERLDFYCRDMANVSDPNTYCDKWHLMISANNMANPYS